MLGNVLEDKSIQRSDYWNFNVILKVYMPDFIGSISNLRPKAYWGLIGVFHKDQQ